MVFQVKHLEDVVIERLFHQVVTQLLPLIDESLSWSCGTTKSQTLDGAIDYIREYLDDYLVGDVYSEVRRKLVNNFQLFYNAICNKKDSIGFPAQLYKVFLDCFVDDSFKVLSLRRPVNFLNLQVLLLKPSEDARSDSKPFTGPQLLPVCLLLLLTSYSAVLLISPNSNSVGTTLPSRIQLYSCQLLENRVRI